MPVFLQLKHHILKPKAQRKTIIYIHIDFILSLEVDSLCLHVRYNRTRIHLTTPSTFWGQTQMAGTPTW